MFKFKVLAQQLIERMLGAMPVQFVPGPIVEHHLHLLDLGSRQPSESGALGKELAQQAIRVLICPPLPLAMGMRKIDQHLCLFP